MQFQPNKMNRHTCEKADAGFQRVGLCHECEREKRAEQEAQAAAAAAQPPAAEAAPAPPPPLRMITINAPIGADTGYADTTPDVRLTSRVQLRGAKILANGLMAQGAKLGNGKEVRTIADAFSWLAEQVGREAGLQ